MIVFPRSKWTSLTVKSNQAADNITGLPYFRPVEVRGIAFYNSALYRNFLEANPVEIFGGLLNDSLLQGHSDVDFNIGVTGHVSGVWCLRGLNNKSSVSLNPSHNSAYVTCYITLGPTEKPTDTLLSNILDARRLVLSRYPGATRIVEFSGNRYLEYLFGKEEFWESDEFVRNLPTTYELPIPELSLGMQSVHVQDLQELLGFWGYYKVRVDGVYNMQTSDAVTSLQADLKDKGLFYYDLDGVYSDHLHRAWLKFLESF